MPSERASIALEVAEEELPSPTSMNIWGISLPKYILLLAAIALNFISWRYSGVSFSCEERRGDSLNNEHSIDGVQM